MKRCVHKMRVLTVGGFASLMPLMALGGPPIAYDNWSVSNGTIAAGCASGFSCTVLSSSPGFLQRAVQDTSSGKNFIQTFVTNKNATGTAAAGLAFSDEGFVGQGTGFLNPNGIADKQQINTSNVIGGTTQSFKSIALLQFGWAAGSGPNVDIKQEIHELTTTKKKFDAFTSLQSNNDADGNQLGFSLAYDDVFTQPQGLDATSGGDKSSSTVTNAQAVAVRQVGGNMLTAGGSAALGNGQSITWSPGNTVASVWVGELFSHTDECKVDSTPRGRCYLAQGYQTLDNKNDSNVISRDFRFNSGAGPFVWSTTPFGTKPVMPAVTTGNMGGKN